MSSPELLQAIDQFYTDEKIHGNEHAIQTVQLVTELAREKPYDEMPQDIVTLTCWSAAFHDPGYLRADKTWSSTQWEHPDHSMQMFEGYLLQESHEFSPLEVAFIKFLILNHDVTNHSYPENRRLLIARDMLEYPLAQAHHRPNTLIDPYNLQGILEQSEYHRQYLFPALNLLREADGLLGDYDRTLNFAKKRNIPLSADIGEGRKGLHSFAWQASGYDSCLLAAYRALIDSKSQKGRVRAWQLFEHTREKIRADLWTLNSDYDDIGLLLRLEDVEEFIWNTEVEAGDGPDPLVYIHTVSDLKNIGLFLPEPLAKFTHSSRLANIKDISYNYCWFDHNKYEVLKYLRGKLIRNYALDILQNLWGGVEVINERIIPHRRVCIYPPIVRRRNDIKLSYEVVNGTENIALARILGLHHIRVLIQETALNQYQY